MHLTPAEQITYYVLWGLSFAFRTAIAVLILRKKQARTFPVFFAYTLFKLIQTAAIFVAFRTSYTLYFYTWWTAELLEVLITLAVVQEIFVVIFKPYDALRLWGTRLYFTTTILLCFFALLAANQHSSGDSPRVTVLLTLDRSASFVQLGLIFFLFLFCRLFGMTWRHYVFGISTGLLIMAAIYTINVTVRTYVGPAVNHWTGIVNSLAVFLGVLVWTYYFASSKSRIPLDRVPGTERLIAWNQALGRVGRH